MTVMIRKLLVITTIVVIYANYNTNTKVSQ